LFVADQGNGRVLQFAVPIPATGAAASRVFGKPSFTSATSGSVTAASLDYPSGVAVDPAGHLFVSDTSMHRVLEYSPPFSTTGSIAGHVFGQPSFTSALPNNGSRSAGTLFYPAGVAATASRLYVADSVNRRVLEFAAPFSATGSLAARV